MPKLIMTKGLPGCGKTTWAKEQILLYPANAWKRVNKDDLRNMIDAGRYSKGAEKYVKDIQFDIIMRFLEEGHNVIVDNTHIEPFWEDEWKEIAKWAGAQFEIKDFTDVPVEVCLEQNEMRPRSGGYVDPEVIHKMNARLKETTATPIVWRKHNPDVGTAIIVDIDGTLADHAGIRGHHEYDRVGEDRPVGHIIRLVQNLADEYKIIVVSGRPDLARDATREWLDNNFVPFDRLYMRETGDYRADNIVKREIFDRYIDNLWNIEFVLDDRDRVVDMWRKDLNIPVLQVNYGDF